MHIQKAPADNGLNRKGDNELLGCWITIMKKLGGGVSASHARALTSAPSHMCVCTGAMPINSSSCPLHFCPEDNISI